MEEEKEAMSANQNNCMSKPFGEKRGWKVIVYYFTLLYNLRKHFLKMLWASLESASTNYHTFFRLSMVKDGQ